MCFTFTDFMDNITIREHLGWLFITVVSLDLTVGFYMVVKLLYFKMKVAYYDYRNWLIEKYRKKKKES